MSHRINLSQVLFLDIETVPAQPSFSMLNDAWKELWTRKAELIRKSPGDTPESLYERAGIYAEFGKIICISTGHLDKEELVRRTFAGHDEKNVLEEFLSFLALRTRKETLLCAHNGKEFDFPYIARRIIINGLTLPPILQVAGKKPWETSFLDTMEMWKFGDYKSYTSLNLLASVLGIPSPKDQMEGKDVGRLYWQEKALEQIVAYCEKDVATIVRILLKFKGLNELKQSQPAIV